MRVEQIAVFRTVHVDPGIRLVWIAFIFLKPKSENESGRGSTAEKKSPAQPQTRLSRKKGGKSEHAPHHLPTSYRRSQLRRSPARDAKNALRGRLCRWHGRITIALNSRHGLQASSWKRSCWLWNPPWLLSLTVRSSPDGFRQRVRASDSASSGSASHRAFQTRCRSRKSASLSLA